MIERGLYNTLTLMGNIGKRIKLLRESVDGRTQSGFAKILGVSRGAVGNWEHNKGIKTENLLLISERIGVPLAWLAGTMGDDDMLPDPVTPPPMVSRPVVPNFYLIAFEETLLTAGVRPEAVNELVAMIQQVVGANLPGFGEMTEEETTRMIVRQLAQMTLTKWPTEVG